MAPATAAPFPVSAPQPNTIENEVLDSYDALQKLANTIKEQELKRKERAFDLARTFAKETREAAIDVERAFQANEAWRVDDEKAGQRIAALTNIRSKVDELFTKLKTDNPGAAATALTRKLDQLAKDIAQQTDAATDLKEEKKKIEIEIGKLPKVPAYTPPTVAVAAAAVAPAAVKRAKKHKSGG